ncbi:hypothetical protein ACFSKU_04170 [Pontibacter silvestris]|uniref:Uncharacterized protein n=1 Tax=Pontibacter silvestris TaxID=2305183 RepID=A0ABW4WVR8_9BACT|nr:hypothetical protein [Pontibacter silvestris]MCC9138631.1 hypothetical protein [Pontibacter silvestris]
MFHYEVISVMCEIDELGSMLSYCDEIVLVHSKEHGGLLQFYSEDYFRGELYIKCGSLLDTLSKAADARGNISNKNVNLLKQNFHELRGLAEA